MGDFLPGGELKMSFILFMAEFCFVVIRLDSQNTVVIFLRQWFNISVNIFEHTPNEPCLTAASTEMIVHFECVSKLSNSTWHFSSLLNKSLSKHKKFAEVLVGLSHACLYPVIFL